MSDPIQNNTPCTPNDTIDLRELFAILQKRKKLIFILTTLITLFAFIYAYFIAKPIYSGSVTLEIGKAINKQMDETENLDNVNNLKSIISNKFPINAYIPRKTTLIKYNYLSANKSQIAEELQKAVDFTLDRHREFAKLYATPNARVKMTEMVQEITVGDTPVKPKKKLIVIASFIGGLMLSIFLAFFLEFIKGMKSPSDE